MEEGCEEVSPEAYLYIRYSRGCNTLGIYNVLSHPHILNKYAKPVPAT